MPERTLARAMRSPAATTVFVLVFAMGGLAYAGGGGADPIDVPAPGDAAPNGIGRPPEVTGDAAAHGVEVSTFARTHQVLGWRFGAEISDLASRGHSQAGEHGPHAGQSHGHGPGANPSSTHRPEDPGSQAGNAPGRGSNPHAAGPAAPGGGAHPTPNGPAGQGGPQSAPGRPS